MTGIKQFVSSLSIEKLNLSISIIFIVNLIIGSVLLWVAFFILWEILLIRLFIKQRNEKKYWFSYTFLAGFIGVLCLNTWFLIKLINI
ncbi:hypothetical protein [Alkaliphilus peptidifermentans]|uniref:Uncharacterized protein n=1 Tax=Alkaliphilus peptidifermentans DSM 18978 TaxID=1120976 RepID=A0A1G5IV68_9FIRM|nr:hypothetical protein [Alkaliphilus peptidifermentans]SCY79601.1 hypothetical protein SAMN03080606_02522 [Alkaliphilus peptidifermentans DSM 18978]